MSQHEKLLCKVASDIVLVLPSWLMHLSEEICTWPSLRTSSRSQRVSKAILSSNRLRGTTCMLDNGRFYPKDNQLIHKLGFQGHSRLIRLPIKLNAKVCYSPNPPARINTFLKFIKDKRRREDFNINCTQWWYSKLKNRVYISPLGIASACLECHQESTRNYT